jgi:hypothetical protein
MSLKPRLLVLAAILAAAALAPVAGAQVRGKLVVVAVRGPISPVCVVGVPCEGPAVGVRIVVSRNGVVVARRVTDRDGRVHVVCAPGRYRVKASYAGGVTRQVRSRWVRIYDNRTVRARFSFDTGIR